jgi:hypothetical protein
VKVLLGGILQAFAGMTVDAYGAAAHRFLVEGRHPAPDRAFHHCGYRPMIDLLGYPAASGFTNSGRDRRHGRAVPDGTAGPPPPQETDGGRTS